MSALWAVIPRLAHKLLCILGHMWEAVTWGGPLLVWPGLCCILLKYKKRITTVAWKLHWASLQRTFYSHVRAADPFFSPSYLFVCVSMVQTNVLNHFFVEPTQRIYLMAKDFWARCAVICNLKFCLFFFIHAMCLIHLRITIKPCLGPRFTAT